MYAPGPGVLADVVFKLRLSDVAKVEKSGRCARVPKLVATCSGAYDPGATVAGVGLSVPNAVMRFDRVVMVIVALSVQKMLDVLFKTKLHQHVRKF